MLRALSVFFLGVFSCAITTIAAQAPLARDSDLVGVYQAAVRNNSDLAAARAQLNAIAESVPQARAALLPQLNGEIDTNSNRSSADSLYGTKAQTRSATSYQATLSQPIFNAAAWFQLQAANATSAQALLEFSATEQDLILQTAEAYYGVLEAQDNLAASNAEEAAFKRQLDQAKERFDVGLSTKTDVLEAQASFDTATANQMLAERSVEDRFQALTTLTNQTYTALSGLVHSLPILPPAPLDAAAWVDTSMQQNLRLQASAFAATSAEENLKQSKAGHAPTINAYASYTQGDNDSLGFINNGSGTNTYTDDAQQSSIGIRLDLPLYTGGRTSAKVRESYALAEQAQFQQESLRRQVVQRVRDTYRAVNTAVEQVSARHQTILSNKSALEATQMGYEVGTRDIVDVLNAQRQLFVSVRNYNNARYAYILSTLRLKQTAGTLSPNDLTELNHYLTAHYNPATDFLPPDIQLTPDRSANSD